MLDDKPRRPDRDRRQCANPDGLAFKIFDGFELGPGLQHEMGRRPVAGNDPKRQALKDRAQGGAKAAEVVGVAVTESDICHRA